MSGYTAAELYADPTLAFRMIHPDDRPEFDRQAADGSLPSAPIVVRLVRKDGRIVWTEQTNTEILDGAGQRVAVEGVARDATIRVEAAAAVKAAESRFRSALEEIGLHVAIMDRTGRILFVNTYLARRTGWFREGLVGRDAFEVFLTDGAHDAQRSAYLRAVELEHAAEDWETEWLAKDGSAVRIAWTSSLVRDESGAVVGISSVGEDGPRRSRSPEREPIQRHRPRRSSLKQLRRSAADGAEMPRPRGVHGGERSRASSSRSIARRGLWPAEQGRSALPTRNRIVTRLQLCT